MKKITRTIKTKHETKAKPVVEQPVPTRAMKIGSGIDDAIGVGKRTVITIGSGVKTGVCAIGTFFKEVNQGRKMNKEHRLAIGR